MIFRITPALAACLLVGTVAGSARAYQKQTLVEQTVEETSGLDYLMYLPNGHDVNKGKWPVLVFLHGIGESSNRNGDDITALTGHSPPRLVEDSRWDWPFIVISPQINDADGWASKASALSDVLVRLKTDFGADPNRQYLTGLSYGGSGTWSLGVSMSNTWAALMPLCAGTSSGDVTQLSGTPLFVVHGSVDVDNVIDHDEGRIDAMDQDGTPFFEIHYAKSDEANDAWPTSVLEQKHVFAILDDYGHNVWDATYGFVNSSTSAVVTPKTVPYQWLLKQSLDGSEFVDPRTAPPVNTGGSGGMAGAAGMAGAGAGGVAGSAGGGAAGAGANSGGMPVDAGLPDSGAPVNMAEPSPRERGCSCRVGQRSPSDFAAFWLGGVAAVACLRRRRSGVRAR